GGVTRIAEVCGQGNVSDCGNCRIPQCPYKEPQWLPLAIKGIGADGRFHSAAFWRNEAFAPAACQIADQFPVRRRYEHRLRLQFEIRIQEDGSLRLWMPPELASGMACSNMLEDG